jgi:hypothetical protein
VLLARLLIVQGLRMCRRGMMKDGLRENDGGKGAL